MWEAIIRLLFFVLMGQERMESYRIVVLGGPAAGKTVFLASLYSHLWQGLDELTMRAATGTMHSDLLAMGQEIQAGKMPPATQALRHLEFELRHFEQLYSLRFLDYPGELFRKVFYDTTVDSEEARQLYDVSTTADGIIALVDPISVVDGSWDIDYALSNLMRFYKSNGRKQPKFVVAFTKRDKTDYLFAKKIKHFVRQHLPHLSSELGNGMRLQHFSSIINRDGKVTFASPVTVTAPLRCVIDALEAETSLRNREMFLRQLSWKRALRRCLLLLACATMILLAFATGVVCRSTPAPSTARLQESND